MIKVLFNSISELWDKFSTYIFNLLNFPAVPPELVNAVNWVFDLMGQGMRIVDFFLPLSAVRSRLGLVFAVYSAIHLYKLAMWVLRKIPFLNVK